jgi:hypothetical protein
MDFIERWLNISPDGGSGASELLIIGALGVILIGIVLVGFRRYLPRNLTEFLQQFGKRDRGDRFDN